MIAAKEALKAMEYALGHIKETVAREKTHGKKIVGCMPILIPEELVHAAGAFPVGIWGAEQTSISRAAEFYPPYACSVVQSITELGASGVYDGLDAVLLTGMCDTLKCLTQTFPLTTPGVRPIFVKYPQNYTLAGGGRYYLRELGRVRRALEEVTGETITEARLRASIELYNRNRRTMLEFVRLMREKPGLLTCRERGTVLKARFYMDKEEHTALTEQINRALREAPAPVFRGVRLYVSGIMLEPFGLLDQLDELGFSIVGDELARESRQFRTLVPQGLRQMERLVRQFQAIRGEAFLYDPQKQRCDLVAEEAGMSGAEGLLFAQMKFCDTDEYDYPWVRDSVQARGIPVLALEIEQGMNAFDAARTRLQAFRELVIQRRGGEGTM